MSMLARHNPEAYEAGGDNAMYDLLVESVDTAEHSPCPVCGEIETRFAKPCRRCKRNMDEDRERREVEGV